ncbi:MAG: cellulase family glycosylhydrolase [Thermodesulfobacteriota bacterium]
MRVARTPALIFVVMLFIAGIAPQGIGASSDFPPNWPWRGVVITSFSPPDAVDMEYLSRIGVNAVSIHLYTRLEAEVKKISGSEAFAKELERVDVILDECKRRNITAVITAFQIPMDPALGLTQNSPEFWDDPERLKEAVYVAGELAQRFKGRGRELAAYEILSEPLVIRNGKNEAPAAWPVLMKDIVKEIRKYDKTRFISITPGIGGLPRGYKDFKPLDDPYIIYGAHMYEPHAFTHQGIRDLWPLGVKYPGRVRLIKYWDRDALEGALKPLLDFRKMHNVPVWIGEFSAARWGEGAEEYLKDLIGIFDGNGWAWTYHCFKCWHGWDPDYAGGFSTDDPKDWKQHYKGRDTERWTVLKKSFSKNKQGWRK